MKRHTLPPGPIPKPCTARSWTGRSCTRGVHADDFHSDERGGWRGDSCDGDNGITLLPDHVRRAYLAYVEFTTLPESRLHGGWSRAAHLRNVLAALTRACGLTWADGKSPEGEWLGVREDTAMVLDEELVRERRANPKAHGLNAALVEAVGTLASHLRGRARDEGRDGERTKRAALRVAALAVRVYEESDTSRHNGSFLRFVEEVGRLARLGQRRARLMVLERIRHEADRQLKRGGQRKEKKP